MLVIFFGFVSILKALCISAQSTFIFPFPTRSSEIGFILLQNVSLTRDKLQVTNQRRKKKQKVLQKENMS